MATLADIRTRCQQESDLVNSTFISNAEWLNLINGSYNEAYGLWAQTYGADYFSKNPPQTITTDGTNTQFALASDVWKVLGVDVQVSSPAQWVALKPFAFGDRNIVGLPNQQTPAAGQTVRVWYIPTLTLLSADADVVNTALTANGGEEYIVADACIKALAKEESDVSVFLARKQQLKARLEAEAANRDAGNPSRIVDVRARRAGAMQYRLLGTNLWLLGGASPGWWYGMAPDDWGPASDADWGW